MDELLALEETFLSAAGMKYVKLPCDVNTDSV